MMEPEDTTRLSATVNKCGYYNRVISNLCNYANENLIKNGPLKLQSSMETVLKGRIPSFFMIRGRTKCLHPSLANKLAKMIKELSIGS